MNRDTRRTRVLLALLLVTSVSLVLIDSRAADSPLDRVRGVAAAVFGPVEQVAAAIAGPVSDAVDGVSSIGDDADEVDRLRRRNEELTRRLRTSELDRNRVAQLDALLRVAGAGRYRVVPAQVIAIGAAQSFSWTVTIDAGTRQGVSPDLMVVTGRGLVGRVISSTATTSTVLLIVDGESTIGGRLSDSMELGFLDGDGDVSGQGTLELSLVDHTVSPEEGDTVVTWGSRNDAPYLPGVPIGSVVSVHSTPSELTQTAEIEPFVDFSSLDVVAVVTGHRGGDTATDVAASSRRSGR